MSAEKTVYGTPERNRAIPSLDGLRAIAVGTVILSHSNEWTVSLKAGTLRFALIALSQGGLGVNAFFIISGFLISTLLLNEADRDGSISLKRFYFRRSLRIFPAYYVYLLIAAIVAWTASRPIPPVALLTAATYTSNYFPYVRIQPFVPSWYTLHTWSLSVEEQFYLVWPLLLKRLTHRSIVIICLAILVCTPVLRVLTVLYFPEYGMAEQWYRLFHTDADALALGSLLAFCLRFTRSRNALERSLHPAIFWSAIIYLVICAHLITHEKPWVTGLFAITFANACLGYVIAYAVLRPTGLVGKVLNVRFLRHFGVISYSIYLWQQLFLGPYAHFTWWWNVSAVIVCAELSFWFVERPFLRLRSALEARFMPLPSLRNVSTGGTGISS